MWIKNQSETLAYAFAGRGAASAVLPGAVAKVPEGQVDVVRARVAVMAKIADARNAEREHKGEKPVRPIFIEVDKDGNPVKVDRAELVPVDVAKARLRARAKHDAEQKADRIKAYEEAERKRLADGAATPPAKLDDVEREELERLRKEAKDRASAEKKAADEKAKAEADEKAKLEADEKAKLEALKKSGVNVVTK